MKYPILLVGMGLALSAPAFAEWLPNLPSLPTPERLFKQQCLSRIAQYPNVKLTAQERVSTCNCMTQHAQRKLSSRDILNLAQLSNAELERQYGDKAKKAFDACQAKQ